MIVGYQCGYLCATKRFAVCCLRLCDNSTVPPDKFRSMGRGRLRIVVNFKANFTAHPISSPNLATYAAMRATAKVSNLVCLMNLCSRTWLWMWIAIFGNMVGRWTIQTTYREMKVDWYAAGSQTNQVQRPLSFYILFDSNVFLLIFTFLFLWEGIQWRFDWYTADSQTKQVPRVVRIICRGGTLVGIF